jgi:3-deoxy-D-manno-octulosonic-acid transferase
MDNFGEVFESLVEVEGIEPVTDEQDLLEKVARLLSDPSLREKRGAAAYSVIESSLGAVDKCLDMIDRVLADAEG